MKGWRRPRKLVFLGTRNPNKCTPYLRAISTKIEIISTTRGGTSQNSTDLDSGRRPKLKSDEFFEVPPLVVEIISISVEIVRRLGVHLLGFGVLQLPIGKPSANLRHPSLQSVPGAGGGAHPKGMVSPPSRTPNDRKWVSTY